MAGSYYCRRSYSREAPQGARVNCRGAVAAGPPLAVNSASTANALRSARHRRSGRNAATDSKFKLPSVPGVWQRVQAWVLGRSLCSLEGLRALQIASTPSHAPGLQNTQARPRETRGRLPVWPRARNAASRLCQGSAARRLRLRGALGRAVLTLRAHSGGLADTGGCGRGLLI